MEAKKYDIVIIGGGAAGLFCASLLKNKKSLLIEHNKTLGKKILISGGGRCNFTNLYSTHEDFDCQNPHFCKSALSQFTPYDFLDLVEKEKIPYFEKKEGQLFCQNSAKEILNFLGKKAQDTVEIQTGKSIEKISYSDCFQIVLGKEIINCSRLVIATGGLSLPSIGASPFGHEVAKQFGHKIIPASPALVPFKLEGFENLKGVSLEVEVCVGKRRITEDLLFTHKGLSGPAILKISLYWKPGDPLEINWLPEREFSLAMNNANKKLTLKGFLNQLLPKSFVQYFLDCHQFAGEIQLANLKGEQVSEISHRLHTTVVYPTGTEGFRKAEVTRGGVSTEKISSKTMESKLVPGLFFIGEVLDVTGQLGGHNFQWAWSSAYCAALALQTV